MTQTIDNNGDLKTSGEWRRNFDIENFVKEVKQLE